MKNDSSDEYSESERLTSIVKAISKLKKEKVKAKVSSSECLKDKSKVKGGDNIAKLLKIIRSIKLLCLVISSIYFKYQGESKPGEIINLLSWLIEGWDPPVEIHPTNALKSIISSLAEV